MQLLFLLTLVAPLAAKQLSETDSVVLLQKDAKKKVLKLVRPEDMSPLEFFRWKEAHKGDEDYESKLAQLEGGDSTTMTEMEASNVTPEDVTLFSEEVSQNETFDPLSSIRSVFRRMKKAFVGGGAKDTGSEKESITKPRELESLAAKPKETKHATSEEEREGAASKMADINEEVDVKVTSHSENAGSTNVCEAECNDDSFLFYGWEEKCNWGTCHACTACKPEKCDKESGSYDCKGLQIGRFLATPGSTTIFNSTMAIIDKLIIKKGSTVSFPKGKNAVQWTNHTNITSSEGVQAQMQVLYQSLPPLPSTCHCKGGKDKMMDDVEAGAQNTFDGSRPLRIGTLVVEHGATVVFEKHDKTLIGHMWEMRQ